MDQKQELEQAKEDLQLASYAQQVVNNPAYKQAMMVIRADLLQKFTSVSFKDTDELLEIKRRMDTIEQLQGLFERTMKTGKIAEHKIGKLTAILNKIRN
jgi:hypothetical protein